MLVNALSGFLRTQKWRWLALLTSLVLVIAGVTYTIAYRTFVDIDQNRATEHANFGAQMLQRIMHQFKPFIYVISRDPNVIEALSEGASEQINERLFAFSNASGLEAVYLMDTSGVTVASSNYQNKINYLGQHYSFRPYFKQAMEGNMGTFFAVGATTGIPGYFIALPVRQADQSIVGVVAAKLSVNLFQEMWRAGETQGFVTNADGVVILASNAEWLYHSLRPLTSNQLANLRLKRQFSGKAIVPLAWQPVGLNQLRLADRTYLYSKVPFNNSRWQLHHLTATDRVQQKAALVAIIATASLLLLLAWALVVRSRRMRQALQFSEQTRYQLSATNQKLEREIEERHLAQQQLSKAQQQLVQSSRMAALGQLSASVIHELGQPLFALRNYLTAAEYDAQGASLPSLLKQLNKVAQRMQNTTDELRFFAKPDAHTSAAVNLVEVINNAVTLAGLQENHPYIQFHLHCDIAQAMMQGHAQRLEQVVVNLLSNACIALDHVSNPRIDLRLLKGCECWLLEVQDNGLGFGEKNPEKLFEAFYTTRSKTNGMGLGLAISAAIVAEHHGKIWALNAPGKGALFKVQLPISSNKERYDQP
ncbi:MAG: cache domain-containing protein [Gammaproteobacteria bacterium]|jgi:two-component system C4-dicarboxylate transport sensor histidine kinase DctB|nr:cache domain-containing protein [Gammaproteobacteria bacterium]